MARRKKQGCGNFLFALFFLGLLSSCFNNEEEKHEEIKQKEKYKEPLEKKDYDYEISTPERKIEEEKKYPIREITVEEKEESETIEAEGYEEKYKYYEETEVENEYIGDDVINRLLTEYSTIAEFPINPDNVRNGAYNFNAITSCNGTYIMIYNSNDVFVDISIEDWDDSRIYPVFRDFMKTLDKNLTDNEIYNGWQELLTKKYNWYDCMRMGNIECACYVDALNNGTIRYTVKTGCKTYKNIE